MTVTVTDHPDAGRFEATRKGRVLGFAAYARDGDVLALTHTEVDPAEQGQGVAAELARAALDVVREQGLRVRPLCSYMADYVRRHPAYADLVVDQAQDSGT